MTQRLPALQLFIDEMRALYREGLPDSAHWKKARPLVGRLLGDPVLKERSRAWPSGRDQSKAEYVNLLLYEDPDYKFAVNALVKAPGETTPVHDHAHTWTLYGVLEGGERVVRYRRKDDGRVEGRCDLECVGDHEVKPGYIDFVPPWDIHAEHNGPHRTVGVIVRSAKVGGFLQNLYRPEQGAVEKFYGPRQVPFELD